MEKGAEQIVFAEATIALSLLASYAYHKGTWKKRKPRDFISLLDKGKKKKK